MTAVSVVEMEQDAPTEEELLSHLGVLSGGQGQVALDRVSDPASRRRGTVISVRLRSWVPVGPGGGSIPTCA